MMIIWLAFWIYQTGAESQNGMKQMPDIEACWKEAAKMQKFWADNHPKSEHFQIDVSCITEYFNEI